MRFVNNPFTDKLDVGSLTGSGAPPVETVSGNDGISVGPDGTTFNLDLLGDNAQGVNVTGDAGTNTLTISGIDASETQKGVLETSSNTEAAAQSSTSVALTPSNIPSLFSSTPLSASQGGTGVSSPAANSLLVTNGSSAFTVLGTAGNGQIPIGAIGSAPVLANLASSDASIVITNGPGTIDLTVAATTAGVTTLTGNTGGAIAPVLGNINTVGTGNITVAGAGNTLTAELTGLTNHNVLIGAGTATVTNLAPSATSGIPLISQGSSADPTFGTAVVVGGGTGATSFTAHSLILGQGTSSMTSLGSATNGQIPIGSTGADPVLGNITSTGGSITVSNTAGAIDISTTVTTPTGALGTVLQGQGIGSNPAYSTATYPATTSVSQLLYSSSANVVGGLSTANNGTLVTSNTGVPSILAGPGTTGNILQSNAAAAPSYSTASYPSTATSTGALLRANGTNWVPTTATFPTTTTANQILYSNSANTVTGLATANSGVLTTSTSGVPAIDTTNFSVLSTGVQMKGNNTNTAPPVGFMGEQIRALTTRASPVTLTSNVVANIASISLTAGIWDVSSICMFESSGGVLTETSRSSITTVSTGDGTPGDNRVDSTATRITSPAILHVGIIIPAYRMSLSATTTVYMTGLLGISSGPVGAYGRISATRVG